MKFETYVHKILVYHQKIFGEDSPICTRARGVNLRNRDEKHTRTFMPRSRVQMGESSGKFVW